MGNICSCLSSNIDDSETSDVETRRRMMVKAAEQRYQDQQHRGIRNLDSVKRWREISIKADRAREEEAMGNSKFPGLQWTMNN